jgi:hypothetical protein
VYRGTGETIPIEFVNGLHPTLAATVTPIGGRPIERRFILDIGSSAALILHSPFVKEQQLPGPGVKTIPAIGGAGAGGRTTGVMGRVESLRIGSVALARPIATFSHDTAGALANTALAGNIGAQVAMRFRLFLDYGRKRIIFEPTPGVKQPFDRAFSGLVLRALGDDYRTFRVLELLEESPAGEAGIRAGDIITAIDDVPAGQLTITQINEMFEKPVRYALTIRRGSETLNLSLTPRPLI